MAQFYKMTLYVCDLEDDLSLKEIKTLIDERALSGVSVNAICRFSNEHSRFVIARSEATWQSWEGTYSSYRPSLKQRATIVSRCV